jgi:uncharacterized membrane protein
MLMLMRILHVGLGVFWVGTLLFTAFLLFPAMRDAGPDGAKVGAQLVRRNFAVIMPVTAIVTILAGLWLYWRISGGFDSEYMRSAPAQAYGVGGATAILALIIGLAVVRPAMLKATALGATPEAQALRARAGKANVWVALLLVVTLVTMAIARYL